jgi:hypothetical protein
MQKETDEMAKLRMTIIILSSVAFMSLLSMTLTVFAWGIGENVHFFLILYPALLISTILVIAKARIGYLFTLVICLSYAILLTNDVGKFLVFDNKNYVLFLVLLLPYLIVLILIPLTIIYLIGRTKNIKWISVAAMALSLSFLIYSIADRYNKDYSDNIFIDAEIKNEGQIILSCKPAFADSRIFVLSTDSKKFEEQIKAYGEFYQGSYFLPNTVIIKNFRFNTLKSITIKQVGDKKIIPHLTWTADEIKGEFDFLQP